MHGLHINVVDSKLASIANRVVVAWAGVVLIIYPITFNEHIEGGVHKVAPMRVQVDANGGKF